MQYLQSAHGYELSTCSSIIRNLVYDHGRDNLSTNTEDNVTTTAEEKAAAASNRHSEAERRRRKRINGHLSTLRSLLPNTVKSDKASLLAEVVRRVKELKNVAAELKSRSMEQSDETIQNNEYCMIPSENDELVLTYIGEDSSTKKIMIKARMCCEDRADLIGELTRGLGLMHAKLVRAEIGTVGGRIKCVLWVHVSAETIELGVRDVRRVLKVVMDRAMFLDLPRNKRPRLVDHF
ncbi:transcription factor bHLH30-like [Rutidosis leptorrhynchoides]|uniref:transcription factor bHLH30-like n=1 Tax=Rutidosis leptorrhynchoides TaxID=125765 RepID=UPI003A992B8E